MTFLYIPESNWWIIRDKFKSKLPTEVNKTYLKTLLGLTSEGAAQNLMSPLRRLGLIDDDNKPTDLANIWRNDSRYADACKIMIENTYPQELRDLFSGNDIDKDKCQQWFMDTGKLGEAPARQAATTYIMLNEAIPKPATDFLKKPSPKPGETSSQKRKRSEKEETKAEKVKTEVASQSLEPFSKI